MRFGIITKKLTKKELVWSLLAIAAGIAAIALLSISIKFPPSHFHETAYNGVHKELQIAVDDYMDTHNGALPVSGAKVSVNGTSYPIVDICMLLKSNGGELHTMLDGCIAVDGSGNDNCDAGCTGCEGNHSYIWVVDVDGGIHSACVGSNCSAQYTDGYQQVWP
jgi:hypothetical protein